MPKPATRRPRRASGASPNDSAPDRARHSRRHARGGSGHAAGALSAGGDVFTGFQSNSKDPIQVDAKTLETYEEGKQRISVFSGDVVVTPRSDGDEGERA